METTTRRGLPRAMVNDVFLAPVHINAGGTIYTTTLDTLTKYPESKLAKLFDGTLTISIDPISRHYFLDVNGSVFAHVLDFLRYGELLLPDDFTQLPLLTKLAEFFGIQGMVEALHNVGDTEYIESEEISEAVIESIKKNLQHSLAGKEMNSLEKTIDSLRGQEETCVNKKISLDAEHVKEDAADTSKITIEACELGIVEGGRVDFGIIESAAMKGTKLETEIFTAKAIETQKMAAGNIESGIIETKSTKVEMFEAENFKSGTVEMGKVHMENVEIQKVETGSTKVEMLETKALKAQTVEMEKVNTGNVEVKLLQGETLKLKNLEVDCLTAGLLNPSSNHPEGAKSATNNSTTNVVLVQFDSDRMLLITTDKESRVNKGLMIESYPEPFDYGYRYFFFKMSPNDGYSYHPTTLERFFEAHLVKVFQNLIKEGFKLCSVTTINPVKNTREYVFIK